MKRAFKNVRLLVRLSFLFLLSNASHAGEMLPPGFRPRPPGVHALVGGNIFVKPGQKLENGTIVIRDGLIEAVGGGIALPADARVWDMKGTTIYAGFIEPYMSLDATNEPVSTTRVEPIAAGGLTGGGIDFYGVPEQHGESEKAGPGYQVARITPEHRSVRDYSPKYKVVTTLRELGFTSGVVVPSKGIVRGTSALVALSDEDPNRTILKPDVFQHVAFEGRSTGERAYPSSVMGIIASVRQSFFDAQHYALEQADYQRHPKGRKRPEFNPALEALAPAIARRMRVVIEPGSALMIDRAAKVAAELGLDFCLVSCGQEWRRPDLAGTTGARFIVPLNFPVLPKLPDEDDWEQVTLDELRAWDWAPENPAVLRQQGVEIALSTYGLSDRKKFRENLQFAIDRGLSEEDALAALTTVPASMCGVENQLGTVEPGRLANLTVVAGDSYFNPEAKVREVWVDGVIYRTPGKETKSGNENVSENPPSRESVPETRESEKEEPEKQAKPSELAGPPGQTNETAASREPKAPKPGKKEQVRALRKVRTAHSPQEGRGPLPLPRVDPLTSQPGLPDPSYTPIDVVVDNATLWLCDEKGTVVTDGRLWLRNGRIAGAGKVSVPPPPGALVIDGTGLHVTPGIIDCHSHTAILGPVNEATLPSTAMVRISDVVNSETENFYQQLAGGVTAVNLLHGSANPIGGQNCVIKLRNGASPEELIFQAAPPGIKFALGENVKQSNWGEKSVTRFPQTRMGVRTFIANRFAAAREYLAEWDAYRSGKPRTGRPITVPPRRDLELEAIGEILQGKRWIHCHSYRQDEILMLMRLMESFGVKIGTFQHVLEGYKIADEIAADGAGGSTFSDWWAYKFEVYDAIPYNGSLMRERGVVVSFNSDSSELARRLYLEAAKAVKYGGTPEPEALKFVTLNPAKQLRIDKYVGSLEPGKDGDFAIWSRSPLDSKTVCLQTWIEGKKYFDRALDANRTVRLERERDELVTKAKKVARLSGSADGGSSDDGESFFQRSLEHEFDGIDRNCLDEE